MPSGPTHRHSSAFRRVGAAKQSLNSKPGCIKVVDTFRGALLFCSVSKAEELGIPLDRWVFPWASTESNYMVPVSARRQLDACPGAKLAGMRRQRRSGSRRPISAST